MNSIFYPDNTTKEWIDQWKEISNIAKERNLLPFFDCAYQGFASGDARKDAAAVRMFVEDGHNIAVVQSFSKNFGLYGQRIGALSVVADSPEEAQRVVSQLKVHIRPNYSNPPRHGARIVCKILESEEKTNAFVDQCMGMAKRIDAMRSRLRKALEELGSSRSWEHITKQIGMFAYSGMSKDEVVALREKHHIYCTLDGRISMAVSKSNSFPHCIDIDRCMSRFLFHFFWFNNNVSGCNLQKCGLHSTSYL